MPTIIPQQMIYLLLVFSIGWIAMMMVSKFLYLHTLSDRYVVCTPMDGGKPFATTTSSGFGNTVRSFIIADVGAPSKLTFVDSIGKNRTCNGQLLFVENDYCGGSK